MLLPRLARRKPRRLLNWRKIVCADSSCSLATNPWKRCNIVKHLQENKSCNLLRTLTYKCQQYANDSWFEGFLDCKWNTKDDLEWAIFAFNIELPTIWTHSPHSQRASPNLHFEQITINKASGHNEVTWPKERFHRMPRIQGFRVKRGRPKYLAQTPTESYLIFKA